MPSLLKNVKDRLIEIFVYNRDITNSPQIFPTIPLQTRAKEENSQPYKNDLA
jgi:hypothetical protein